MTNSLKNVSGPFSCSLFYDANILLPFSFETGYRSTTTYKELNGKIELCSGLFSLALFSSGLLSAFSVLLFTIVNYCVFGLGSDSFYLIFPTKWVRGTRVKWIETVCSNLSSSIHFWRLGIHLIGGQYLDIRWHGYQKLQSAVLHIWFWMNFSVFTLDHVGSLCSSLMTLPKICERSIVAKWRKNIGCQSWNDFVTSSNCIRMWNGKQQWADFGSLLIIIRIMIRICFLCRLAIEFNGIYKYSLFAFFVWSILAICCMFITIQFQLVEYWFAFSNKNLEEQKLMLAVITMPL